MKHALATIILACTLLSAAGAAEPSKISIDAKIVPIKDFMAQLGQKSGATIVLDPKAEGSVTISLTDVELSQALDVATKLNKLVWKKLRFAKPTEETVKLDQLKSAILALASMQIVGLSVEDPATKTTAVFAKNLPATPDVAAMKLPEGYTWVTAYVVMPVEKASEVATDASASKSADRIKALGDIEKQRLIEMANMTPEDRKQCFANEWVAQMNMTPEARQALLRDRIQAAFSLDPQYRDQLRKDMRSVFGNFRH